MKSTDIPASFPIPFASAAVPPYVHEIPEDSQIPITPGAASLTDGFPPLNFLPVEAGGIPPFGNDMNGILKQITQWNQWQSAGGPVFYDEDFADSIGGYPKGALLSSAVTFGKFWFCTVDDNESDPDADGAGWSAWPPAQWNTGDARPTLRNAAASGWLLMNDGTIGNSSANATSLASADAEDLFTLIWNNVSNTYAPLFNSAGTPTARGASAAADWAANRAISLTKQLGRALGVAGAGSGLTSRQLGQTVGEESHALTSDENGPHIHPATTTADVLAGGSNVPTGAGYSQFAATVTVGSSGLGTPHNNMQPTAFWNVEIKL